MILSVFSCTDIQEPVDPPVENEVNEFVWGAMNSWYFWQNEVPDLSDFRFESRQELTQYLNAYPSPNALFRDLRSPEDRFSWIVEDYEELNRSFQGISKSFGFEYSLVVVNDSIAGYVEYVLPDSPAGESSMTRGDIFTHVDGQRLTFNNYRSLLNQDEYALTLVEMNEEGNIIEVKGESNLTAVTLTENPVLKSTIIAEAGRKIGYLSYNSFNFTFHSELNAAFTLFNEVSIDELIVDLRYNSGGRVSTAQALASMICGSVTTDDVFSLLAYNDKHTIYNRIFSFTDVLPILDGNNDVIAQEEISPLSIDRVYFLTGRSSASASEMLIHGLEPHMDVIQIGTTTVGKNEGSITLYDSPRSDYISQSIANPNHKWALQPIVSKVVNSLGDGDYADGLIPDIELDETDFFFDLKPLGSPDEILIRAALDHISGIGVTARAARPAKTQKVYSSKERNPRAFELVVPPPPR